MKKLKNNSGATILMALLLILLAMAVGAAILTLSLIHISEPTRRV